MNETGTIILLASFALLLLVALAIVLRRRWTADTKPLTKKTIQGDEENQQASSSDKPGPDDGTYVKLMFRECLIYGAPEAFSPGVQSRFRTTDINATMEHLSQRARSIAQANPWVLGRVKTHPKSGQPALWVPSQPDFDSFLQVVWVEDNFDEGLKDCFIPAGKACLDQDIPICKLRVIRSKLEAGQEENSEEFVLVIVINHMVGELNAFYRLWGMLNESSPIEELIVERVHDFWGGKITLMKGTSWRRFLYTVVFTDISPFHKWFPFLRARQTGIYTMHHVNMEWVEEQKRLAVAVPAAGKISDMNEEIPFVSSSDVLMSWFFSQFQPSAAVAVFDLRERHPAITRNHMGNYMDSLVLYPAHYDTPREMRRAVRSWGAERPLQADGSPRPARPGPGWRSAGISGWHGRYEDLQLPHAERINHLPYLGFFKLLPANPGPNVALIFRTSSSTMGFISNTKIQLKDMSALGDPIPFHC